MVSRSPARSGRCHSGGDDAPGRHPVSASRWPSRRPSSLGRGARGLLGSAAPAGTHPTPAPPTYYLALGDSLSQGVQPDAAGASVETRYGYPDQVYAALRPSHPTLQLVKLGCPGETTSTMINGGICHYQGGSQLAAATAFLRAHRSRVLLVSIDIGANDPEDCAGSGDGQPSLTQLASCAATGIPAAVSRLTTIMARLKRRRAGRPHRRDELLPARPGGMAQRPARPPGRLGRRTAGRHLQQPAGPGLRQRRRPGCQRVRRLRDGRLRRRAGRPGTTPRNVALLCQWTWECAAPPRGPNQHANQAGYQVIARTLLKASGLS